MEVKTKAKAAILMEMEVGTKNEKGCRLLGDSIFFSFFLFRLVAGPNKDDDE